jgi:hypothetical protein
VALVYFDQHVTDVIPKNRTITPNVTRKSFRSVKKIDMNNLKSDICQTTAELYINHVHDVPMSEILAYENRLLFIADKHFPLKAARKSSCNHLLVP